MGAERPVGESVAHTDRETEPRKKLTKAYDSDPLDRHLDEECGIEMIASNRQNRSKTQDGRALRRRAVISGCSPGCTGSSGWLSATNVMLRTSSARVRLGCMKIVLRYL